MPRGAGYCKLPSPARDAGSSRTHAALPAPTDGGTRPTQWCHAQWKAANETPGSLRPVQQQPQWPVQT
eukprot:11184098-Lingulodinium_polyedra.AAC.1